MTSRLLTRTRPRVPDPRLLELSRVHRHQRGGGAGGSDGSPGTAMLMGSIGNGPFEPKVALFADDSSSQSSHTEIVFSTDPDACNAIGHDFSAQYPARKDAQYLFAFFPSVLAAPATGKLPNGASLEGIFTSDACVDQPTDGFASGTVTITDVTTAALGGSIDVTSATGAVRGTFTASLCDGLT